MLSGRLAIQIEISLAAGDEHGTMMDGLVVRAKALGLTGAEIETARQGRSFDVRDAAAVALAKACRDGSLVDISRMRQKAAAAGLSEAGISATEQLAKGYLARLHKENAAKH